MGKLLNPIDKYVMNELYDENVTINSTYLPLVELLTTFGEFKLLFLDVIRGNEFG